MEHIKRLVDSLTDEEKRFLVSQIITSCQCCANCGNNLPFESYILEFGKIRRRAGFCARDCLEYFMKNVL